MRAWPSKILAVLAALVPLSLVTATGCGPNAGSRQVREATWDELRTVALKNCDLQRIGSPNDGGYAMCKNLIKGQTSAYSYGIAEEDNWGCQISKALAVPVHQYDCFTPHRPKCEGGSFVFHDECIGPKAEMQMAGKVQKPFDNLANQIKKNGDDAKHLIVKIDVEGAEWETFKATPDDVFSRIDQLIMEFHDVSNPLAPEVLKKLKKQFHLVTVHFNNHGCNSNWDPLPARTFQALLVNKQVAEVDPGKPGHRPGDPPHAPDGNGKDCQPTNWR